MRHDQVRFTLGMQGWFHVQRLIDVIHHFNRLKKKNHRILSKRDIWQNPATIHDKNSQEERRKTKIIQIENEEIDDIEDKIIHVEHPEELTNKTKQKTKNHPPGANK